MGQYGKLIFVSGDDTTLGPMAEAIMQSRILLGDMDITSRGVVVLFPEPINPKAEAVLVSNGLTMKDHMSAPLLRSDFAEGTLILATSEDVRQKVLREFAPIMWARPARRSIRTAGRLPITAGVLRNWRC